MRLRSSLGLEATPIAKQHACAPGLLKGAPVELHTRCYASEEQGRLSLARIVDSGGLTLSVTLVLIPASGVPAPLLGLDCVAFGPRMAIIALDLSPSCSSASNTHARELMHEARVLAQRELELRPLPEFAREVFSEHAVIASPPPAALPCVVELVDFVLGHYPELLEQAIRAPRDPDVTPTVERWLRQMRHNKREHGALARIFGEDFTADYLHDCLFALP